MYRLTNNPDIIFCMDTGTFIPRDHWMWVLYEKWVEEGNTPLPVPLPFELHSKEHYRYIRDCAWKWMTEWVQSKHYDTVESCVGYFNSNIDRFRAEARAMVAWRDDVNMHLEELVLNPPPDISTWDQVKVLLPQPESYEWVPRPDLPLDQREAPLEISAE